MWCTCPKRHNDIHPLRKCFPFTWTFNFGCKTCREHASEGTNNKCRWKRRKFVNIVWWIKILTLVLPVNFIYIAKFCPWPNSLSNVFMSSRLTGFLRKAEYNRSLEVTPCKIFCCLNVMQVKIYGASGDWLRPGEIDPRQTHCSGSAYMSYEE